MKPRIAVRAGLAALGLAVVVAGCSGGGATPLDTTPSAGAGVPMPAGVTEVRSLPDTASDTSCGDPSASYRPAGAEAGGTLALIRARGRLIAGVDQNTYKFGDRNPVTGQLEGFDIDIARAVAKAIFGNPDAIQFRVVNPGTRIAAVQNHDVDITVDTLSINCARWKDVAFSTAYYQASQRVLVPKISTATSIASLGGRRVCAAAGTTAIQNIVNATVTGPVKPIGVAVSDRTDCLVMLQQHQVDAISTDDTILAGLAVQDPSTKIVGPAMATDPYGIAIAKDRIDLVRFVNGVLQQIRTDGEWQEIYNRWLAGLLGGTGTPPTPLYRD